MAYFTYRIFRDIALDELKSKTESNLALYSNRSDISRSGISGFSGNGCSALLMGPLTERALSVLGYQFHCVWMDVRFQDNDAWDLTIYEGTTHKVSHHVDPWLFNENYKYDQKIIDYRVNLVCEHWPLQGDLLRPYLLTWLYPTIFLGFRRFKPRKGKANITDSYNYGDANQIHDFVDQFGINTKKSTIEINRNAQQDAAANP